MIRIKCFTNAAWYSYGENHITERHICSKKATSKIGLGIVYMGEEVSMVPDCIPGLTYLRHSMTYTYAASTGLFSSPQSPEISLCVNDNISLYIHLAFVVTTRRSFYLKYFGRRF